MNDVREGADLTPLAALLVAYAPSGRRDWHRLCWRLDQRLAAVVRRAGDPTIAAIRLAWWDAVLVEGDIAKGRGEPLVEAWRGAAQPASASAVEALIDGWRALLATTSPNSQILTDYAVGRGGGLFALLAGEPMEDTLARAGSVWALWDLAGHAGDDALAGRAIALARERAQGDPGRTLTRAQAPKPLRLLQDLALSDVRAGRVPTGGFAGRHYRRLLWRGLMG